MRNRNDTTLANKNLPNSQYAAPEPAETVTAQKSESAPTVPAQKSEPVPTFIARASHAVKAALLAIWMRKLVILAIAVLLASALMIAAFTLNPAILPAIVASAVATIIASGLSAVGAVGIAATTGTAAAAYLSTFGTTKGLSFSKASGPFKFFDPKKTVNEDEASKKAAQNEASAKGDDSLSL